MKIIKFKTNLGEISVRLEKENLNESISNEEKEFIKKEISNFYNSKKMEDDITKIIKNELKSGGLLESEIEKIVANCIVQAFKQIWIKRSSWSNGITNKTN